MTRRIKPLVWVRHDSTTTVGRGFGQYTAFIEDLPDGGFRLSNMDGLRFKRPTIELAKAWHESEYQEWLSAALEPTDPLDDAMKLPKIRALVAAANCLNEEVIMTMGDKRSSLAQPSRGMTDALAALTKDGE